jgi:signal transduction histidine kinase
MKWSLEEKVIAGSLGAIFLLWGLVNWLSPKNTTDLVNHANRVQTTYDILINLADFYAAMSVAESGRRGYVFSGREEELDRYQTAVQQMKAELRQLQQYPNLAPTQQQRLQQLNQYSTQRLALLQQSVDLYQRDRSAAALQTQNAITDYSVQLREKILALLANIQDIEKQQLQTSLAQTEANMRYRSLIESLAMLLSLVIASGVALVFYWSQKRRRTLQALEQRLKQEQELSQLKLQLFSMISHEFRTPLSVILASSQLLAEILQPQIAQSQLKNLERIQTSAKLMNRLITDILTLTRAEAGNLDYQPDWIEIETFCLNLLDDVQSSNQQTADPPANSPANPTAIAQPVLQFTSQGQCRRVYLDEKLLYSILSNLLLNAVKYSPPGSPVYLKLHCQLDQISFEVEDQGMGIPVEDWDNIFLPFYRGPNVEAIAGSGLGLAVVKKCLELQKGQIRLESQVGQGTRFIVSLPC